MGQQIAYSSYTGSGIAQFSGNERNIPKMAHGVIIDVHFDPVRVMGNGIDNAGTQNKNLRTKDIDQAAQSDGNIPEMPVEGFHGFDFTIEVFFKQILTVVGRIFLVFQVFIVGNQRRGRAVYFEAAATSTRTGQTIPFDHHMPQFTTAVLESTIEFSVNQQTTSALADLPFARSLLLATIAPGRPTPPTFIHSPLHDLPPPKHATAALAFHSIVLSAVDRVRVYLSDGGEANFTFALLFNVTTF